MNPKLSVMTDGALDNMVHWSKFACDKNNHNGNSEEDPIWRLSWRQNRPSERKVFLILSQRYFIFWTPNMYSELLMMSIISEALQCSVWGTSPRNGVGCASLLKALCINEMSGNLIPIFHCVSIRNRLLTAF